MTRDEAKAAWLKALQTMRDAEAIRRTASGLHLNGHMDDEAYLAAAAEAQRADEALDDAERAWVALGGGTDEEADADAAVQA